MLSKFDVANASDSDQQSNEDSLIHIFNKCLPHRKCVDLKIIKL